MTKVLSAILVVFVLGVITGSTALQCWQETKMPSGVTGGSKGLMRTCDNKNDVCVHMEWLAQTRPDWRWGHMKDCGTWADTCGEDSFRIRDRFKCWTCTTDMCNSSTRMVANISILIIPLAILKMFL